jgi:predicted MFS family arabinose efflux permease
MFAVLLASCVISSAVQTALNTALTTIMREMNITAGTAQWLSSTYSLVMGVMVLATAYMIKRFKNRSLYLLFMSLFTVGLIMSALAPTFAVLLSGDCCRLQEQAC